MSELGTSGSKSIADQGWWVIHGATLLAMLREVYEGANPDMVYAEYYVNCDQI